MNQLYKKLCLSILFACTPLVLSGCFLRLSATRGYTFELSTKDGTQIEKKREDGRMPSEVVAEELQERLESYGLNGVKTQCARYDEVYIQYNQEESGITDDVKKLLIHDGKLALTSKLGDVLRNDNPDEKFLFEDAYVKNVNDYPSINLPVRGAFNNLFNIVKQYKESAETEAAELEDNGDCGEMIYTYYLYLWSDYSDGDDFEEQGIKEGKILAKFDINEINEESSLVSIMTTYINILDQNNDGKYSKKEKKAAVNKANLYAGFINSNPLDYNLTCIKTLYEVGI